MRWIGRFVGGLLLTVVVLGLFVADGIVLNSGAQADGTQQAQMIPWWIFKYMKVATAHYDANGNLTGCSGAPKDCLIIVSSSLNVGITTSDVAVLD